MKLITQITCYNEADSLPATIRDLPRQLPGVGEIEYLVVDDGGSDGTADVAKRLGVHHIVRLTRHHGLARAFAVGMDEALRRGADILVHTDGDNQYRGEDISRLVEPILAGTADLVVGDRQVRDIPHFSPLKKKLQALGSWVVRLTSGAAVPDATSGFRALSRDAALHLNILSDFSYTLDMLIQAGRNNMAVLSVPIRTNPPTRESRLVRSAPHFVLRQATTIFRVLMIYAPLRFFGAMALIPGGFGALIGIRFLYYFFTGQGKGHVQSLILASILLTLAFQLGVLGLLADLISVNRKMLDRVLYRVRRDEPGTGRRDQ
jgi:glycosyltransferase involved in cell wall biosynthesis